MGNRPKVPQFVLWLSGGCLVAAIGVSLLTWNGERPTARPALATALPKEIAGWQGQDLPLGDTEVMNATTRLLNYDDYVYRVYRRGGSEVFVYAMFWKQGSISVREIAGHAPEDCWPANGAQIIGPRVANGFLVGNRLTAPAESREFLFSGGQHVRVAWWHIWGNNIVDRGFDRKSITPTLRELGIWLFQRRGVRHDQFLVRIHTTGDLAAALKTEPAALLLEQFPEVFSAQPL